MTVTIEDGRTIEEIMQLAVGLAVSPDEVVRRAVHEKASRESLIAAAMPTQEKFLAAVRELQHLYAEHREPNGSRTDDEILGYNENGHFD